MRSIFLASALLLSLVVVGCEEDTPVVDDLPQAPQIFPSVAGGFIVFPVTAAGETSHFELVLVNGGRDALVLQAPALSGAGEIAVATVTPAGLSVESRDAATLRLEFTPGDRGVFLGELTLTSNAANLPTITYELVGPASDDPRPDAPDVVAFESTVTAGTLTGVEGEVAVVRLFNVGERTAALSRYEVVDDSSDAFAFVTNSATPGAACSTSAPCGAGEACGEDDFCPAVILGPGQFLVIGVSYDGTASATANAEIDVSDASTGTVLDTVSVGLEG